MFKLAPACKDNIWGGTRLHTLYGKPMPGERLAECWEVSCHCDGPSTIASGKESGRSFAEYWRESHEEDFPLLIKLIDAAEPLSVQVHPDDAYARHHGDMGKTEMWLILSAEPGAFLYYGFERAITREEFARRIEDNTLTEVLHKAEVHPGDVFYIPAGTIHAIGAGILLAEVQQSSNLTYRVFDYGRGRQLHIADALEVTKLSPAESQTEPNPAENPRTLCHCDYFTVREMNVSGEANIVPPEHSFLALMLTEGEAQLQCGSDTLHCKAGDSIFLPEGSEVCEVRGNCRILITNQ